MKVYADVQQSSRLIIPIVRYYPREPIAGELLIINAPDDQGIRYYDDEFERWIPLFSTVNNVWESQVSTEGQYIFELEHEYTTDGKSITVYLDGVRLPSHRVVELDNKTVIIKETYDDDGVTVLIEEGQLLEFNIFNIRL